MSTVNALGLKSFTDQKNEAFIAFTLPQRMLVKVALVLGMVGGGGFYEDPLKIWFIGVYDGTAWPPVTDPQVFLVGDGNNRYTKG